MWQIKNIKIKNICTLKDVEYDFNNGVTTLVFGCNLDNEGQKNNGSGKSALTEAIVFGLTGSPLRNVKNDELINNDEKEAYIRLYLENNSNNSCVYIERTIYRKGSPDISVTMYRNGELVEDGTTVKSGVDEYNKYILDLIGLSKEDIYNCFVLSKHKYQDFLSASDKDKKEIINRFSNANLVDQSINAVKNDLEQIKTELTDADLQLSNIDGKIDATEEQILAEEENAVTRKKTREQKIQQLYDEIEENKDLVIKCNLHIERSKQSIEQLNNATKVLNDIENNINDPFETIIYRLEHEFMPIGAINCNLENAINEKELRTKTLESYKRQLEELQKQQPLLLDICRKTEHIAKGAFEEYDKFKNEKRSMEDLYKNTLGELQAKRESCIVTHRSGMKKLSEYLTEVTRLSAAIKGSIKCPFCGKHFVLNDESFDVEQAKRDLKTMRATIDNIEQQNDDLELERENIEKEINSLKDKYTREVVEREQQLRNTAYQCQSEHDRAQDAVRKEASKIEELTGKIQDEQTELLDIAKHLIDYLFDSIDAQQKKEESIIQIKNNEIASHNGIIQTKEKMIDRIEHESDGCLMDTLKTAVKEYKKQRAVAFKKRNDLYDQADILKTQDVTFTSFKTYLANSKVEALNAITNNFLSQIGSDMRVRFNGYTTLKSGAVRDKISVSLLRDGIDVGSFSKFSEGEKARIQLATILAMNSLTNDNVENGKGLDLLVLDEVLAAVDEEGLSCILSSLNNLKMTSMVISHGKTAESYPYQLVITKQNGISTIG